jgi:hypothetical protein
MNKRYFKTLRLSCLINVALITFSGGSSNAMPLTLDQYNEVYFDDTIGYQILINHPPPDLNIDISQTFTVGKTGWLQKIEVFVQKQAEGGSFSLDIRKVSEGVPIEDDNNVLGRVTLSSPEFVTQPNGFVTFDFSEFHIDVTSGDTLAFALLGSDFAWAVLYGNTDDPYSGGRGFARYYDASGQHLWGVFGPPLDWDYGFRTYVEPVPEPATVLLFGAGLVGLIGARVRNRKK